MSAASFAQWVQPEAPAKTDMVDDGETQLYLFNAGAKGFFLGANDYQTRASVSFSHGVPVKMTKTEDGCWAIVDSVEKFKEFRKTFAENARAIWVDNNSGANCNAWKLTKLANGNYNITNEGVYPEDPTKKLGVAEYYEGKTGNTRLWLYDPEITYEKIVDDEPEPTTIFEGAFWDEWYFVTPEVYNQWAPKAEAWVAGTALKSEIDAKKREYAGIDLAKAEAIYSNSASTAAELDSARTKIIPALVKEFVNAGLLKATVEAPVDATGLIVNPSFETGNTTGWTFSKTNANGLGDSSDAKAAENSNATYTCSEADGNYLFNIWAWGNPITQTISDLPNGIYRIGAMVASSDDCTNVYITAETKIGKLHHAIELQANEAGSKQTYGTRGSMLAAVTDGNLTIGAVGCDADGVSYLEGGRWWYKVDDFRLEFLGNNTDSWKYFQENSDLEFPEYGEETVAMKQLLADYEQAKEDFANMTDPEKIAYALEGIIALSDSIKGNVAAYGDLVKKVKEIDETLNNESSLAGLIEVFADLLRAEDKDASDEAIEALKDENVPEDRLVAAGPVVVLEECALTTEEVVAYTAQLDGLYKYCVSKSFKPGDKVTYLIEDAKFTDPKGNGWTQAFVSKNLTWSAGIAPGFPVAESYHATFDIFQTIDAPDGIYSVSLNGFCRLDDGVDASVPAEVYLNDFATPLMNLHDDPISKDDAIDGVNAYLTNGDDGAWTTNPIFAETTSKTGSDGIDKEYDTDYWIPDGMRGSSVAFSAGRYQAKVYGIVEGGKMTLGIRNTKSVNVWALWSNFELTYEGKTKESVNALGDSYMANANNYLDENQDDMSNPAIDALEAAIKAIKEAATTDEKYDAIIALNSVMATAKENVAAVAEFTTAKDLMDSAANNYGETASAEALAAYEEASDITKDEMTTEEIKASAGKFNKVAAMLRVPGEYKDASDDNAVDFTQTIVSPDFEEDGTATLTGWTNSGAIAFQTQTNDAFDKNNNVYAERWHADGTLDLNQVITELPAGTYELTVHAYASIEDAYIYANDGETKIEPKADAKTEAADCTVIAKVGEDGTLKIGAKGTLTGSTWFCIDNFRLTYYGANSEKTPTDIKDAAEQAKATVVAIYSAAGQKISKLQKGINIVKMSDMSVKKVMVK